MRRCCTSPAATPDQSPLQRRPRLVDRGCICDPITARRCLFWLLWQGSDDLFAHARNGEHAARCARYVWRAWQPRRPRTGRERLGKRPDERNGVFGRASGRDGSRRPVYASEHGRMTDRCVRRTGRVSDASRARDFDATPYTTGIFRSDPPSSEDGFALSGTTLARERAAEPRKRRERRAQYTRYASALLGTLFPRTHVAAAE